jgi:hypothetical protein
MDAVELDDVLLDPRHRDGEWTMETARRNCSNCTKLFRWGAAALLLLFSSATARAADDAGTSSETELHVNGDDGRAITAEERPFTFLVDPSTPGAGVYAFGYSLGLGSGVSADRPIPVVFQNAGVTNRFSLGYGLTKWCEPFIDLNLAVNGSGANATTTLSELVGAKFQLTDPASPWRIAVLGGLLREGISQSWGSWVRATGSVSVGPLLLEANGYLERVFAAGRDGADFIGMLGGSYKITPALRVGAEYVGQDLEEAFDAGAEGGARMSIGPDIAIDVDHGRFQITVATLFGVTAASSTAIVQAGLLGSF